MCESMLGCEGVVYMTWWWIPVLEASRSSRLSVVGYTSCPAHTTEDVQKHADTLDPSQFLYFWLLQMVLYPITYCYVVTSWIWMLFLSRHCSSLPGERFVNLRFQASSDDDNRSPFQLSLVHAIFPKKFPSLNDSESDNETISISWQNVLRWWMAQMRKDSWDDSLPLNTITCLLRSFRCYAYSFAALHCFSQSRFISGTTAPAGPVWRSLSSQMKIAKAKALDHVDGLLRRRWRVNEKHGACRCESSSGLLPTNWIQSLFLSLRMDGATVICSCIGRYHTIPYSWSAAKKSAGQSKMQKTLKWRCKKAFRMQFARVCGWCNQDILKTM